MAARKGPGARKIVVAAHGHCFDGIASAAMFTHLRLQLSDKPVRFRYRSCGYSPTMQTVPEGWLSGDENAIVDFRYTPSRRLTWYFDHHVTGFASSAQRKDALERSKRYFHDPDYRSCARLIADVGRSRYGVDFARFDELLTWADRIDSAKFDSAEQATDYQPPVMRLSAVAEQHGNAQLYANLVPRILVEPLEELAMAPDIHKLWAPLVAAQKTCRQRILRQAHHNGDVIVVDLLDGPLPASAKFLVYALFPECPYSVTLLRKKQHIKIAIGYNPWSEKPRRHDIAAICRRYGGGGHPAVGALSRPFAELSHAQLIIRAVLTELNT